MAHVQKYGSTQPLNIANKESDLFEPKEKTEIDILLDKQEAAMWSCIYCCIGVVAALIPISEVIILTFFWDDYGKCSPKFQWLILAKLIITFIAIDFMIVCRKKRFDVVLLATLIAYFLWIIPTSIIFFTEHHNDLSSNACNQGRTSIYYDFMWIEQLIIYCAVAIGCCIASWFSMAVGFSSYKTENVCSLCAKFMLIALLFVFPICEIIMLILYFNNYDECPATFQWLILSKLIISVATILFGIRTYRKNLYQYYKKCIKVVLITILVMWCSAATTFLYAFDINDSECNYERTGIYYDFMWVEVMMAYLILTFWCCVEIWIRLAFYLAPQDEFIAT